MGSRYRKGDTVRITKGKYAGTVGIYMENGDVYTEGVGFTSCVGDGHLELASGASHADAGGKQPPKKSKEYAEWERLVQTNDQRGLEAYSKKYFQGQDVEYTGLGRLLFGKHGNRWTRKN